MPVEFGLWRIDATLTKLSPSPLALESKLEDVLAQDITVLGLDVMLIGRQVTTTYATKIDLLAIDAQGDLYAIELKRNRTPRDAVAQLLDYGSWVKDLAYQDITEVYSRFEPSKLFEQDFLSRFGGSLPETWNEQHHLVLVASELDPSSERIISYTAMLGVPLNAVFFRHFSDDDRQYLARTWFRDPAEADELTKVAASKRSGPGTWNGRDFYVAIGVGEHRAWEDCRKYGFVSGGQGERYHRALRRLSPGARVFAYIPQRGYVGIGLVVEEAKPVREFTVETSDETKPILEMPLQAANMGQNADDPSSSEYLVRVKWLSTVSANESVREDGMFSNQNIVCRLVDQFTISRLVEHFHVADDQPTGANPDETDRGTFPASP